MTRRIFWELISIVSLIIVLSVYVGNGIMAARTEVRDNLRKEDVTNLKRALEAYYNQHEAYIAPTEEQALCTQSNQLDSWFFGTNSPLLTEQHIDAIPHDVREAQNHVYTYCAVDSNETGAAGYTLTAVLEVQQPDTCSFDEDEQRKFVYKISHEQNKVIYTVFGGSASDCQSED